MASERSHSRSPIRRKSLAPITQAAPSGIPRAIMNTKRAQSLAAYEIAKGMAAGLDEPSLPLASISQSSMRIPAQTSTESVTQPLPRRNVPLGPRKSSIRSRPPQIFASPTGMTRSPNAPPQGSRRHSVAAQEAQSSSNKRPAVSSPLASRPSSNTGQVSSQQDASAPAHKKRRVTFSNRQERTDFMRDEPTMHIRPPIETDMTNLSHTSSSYSDQDSLIPRLSGYGDDLDDRDDTESEEDQSEEEDDEATPLEPSHPELQDESAIDMDLTVDHRQQPHPNPTHIDDMTQDLTAAIASISDPGNDESEPEDSDIDDDDGEQSMQLTHITANGPRTARRRSSGAMSAATDTGSIDMDITGVHVDDSNVDMDITSLSAAKSQHLSDEDESEDEDGDDEDGDGMDLTMPFAQQQESPAKDSPIPKSKLRARDSLAALSKFGRRSLGRKRPSIAPTAVHSHLADDSGASASQVEQLTPTRPTSTNRESTSAVFPLKSSTALPLASPAPATPSRFRQSLVGGLSASPKSPPRRVQVQVKPGESLPLGGVRKASSFVGAAPATPSRTDPSPRRVSDPTKAATPVAMRQSLGGAGALPSAFSLKPGKVPTPFKSRTGGANNARSSIVAAVLPASGREDEETSAEKEYTADTDADQHTNDRDEDPANVEPPPRNITLSEFFSLSGMNFHDGTKAIKVRVVPPTKRENEEEDDPQGQLRAAELNAMRFKAMAGGVPMLESLAQACRELKKSVAEGSVVLKDIEERFIESPPDLVRELLSLSSEAEKKEMESQFKLQKQAARAIAREGYLGWCLDNQYGPEMVTALKSTKASLQDEVESLQADADQMQESVLPTLRQRRDELRKELERLRDRQTQIDATPREDLEVLHAGMAELVPELQSRRAVQQEKTSAMERMQTKLRENLRRQSDLEREISQHRKTTEQIQGYTRHEASRLAAEIRNLEKIHLWKILKASLNRLHLEHDSTFDLVVTLGAGARAQQIELTVVGELQEDVLTQEVAAMLRVEFADVQEAYASGADGDEEAIAVPPLVRHISTVWTSIVHLRSELSHLEAFYPMKRYEIEKDSSPRTLCVSYDVMLSQQCKMSLDLNVDVESLIFDIGEGANSEELIGNQLALFAQGVALRKVYGGDSVDAKRTSEMQERIREGIVGKGFLLGLGHLARIVRDVCKSE